MIESFKPGDRLRLKGTDVVYTVLLSKSYVFAGDYADWWVTLIPPKGKYKAFWRVSQLELVNQ